LQAVGDFFDDLGVRMDRIPANAEMGTGSGSGPAPERMNKDKNKEVAAA